MRNRTNRIGETLSELLPKINQGNLRIQVPKRYRTRLKRGPFLSK